MPRAPQPAPPETKVVALRFDPGSRAFIAELTRRLSALGEIVPRPVEIIELVRRVPRGRVAFHAVLLAADGADEQRIVLEPSEAVRGLMSALRALDRDGDLFRERHIGSSSREEC